MPKYSDQVRETSDTVGAGASIHLTGAVAPWGTFAGAFATGDQIEYAIADGTANSETAWGTYDAGGNTLTRNTIKSTNGNSPINLSGSQQVYCDLSSRTLNQVEAVRHALAGGL
jgi:hypothetical protein